MKNDLFSQGSETILDTYNNYMSCFRNKYCTKEYMLGGESILVFYLKFREFMFNLLNRYIGNLSGKYMTGIDEIEMVIGDKGRFKDYGIMITRLNNRRTTEHDSMVSSVKVLQKNHRDKCRRFVFFVMTLIKKNREKQMQS